MLSNISIGLDRAIKMTAALIPLPGYGAKIVTTNEKHLDKQDHKAGGDNHLPGAQITKQADSAIKSRQEMLDGLKSYRVTKDGNPFTIDMGNGSKVQDSRQTEKITAAVEQALVHRDVSAHIMPGEGDMNPIHKLDLSQVTLKTETSITKDGKIVTTENRGDGSTHASTQEIGSDGKLHVVSKEVRDVNGTVTTEKFDPASGKKTEEIKDALMEKTDTKFNTNGQPETKETTNKMTGQTDQEQWYYANSTGKCIWHSKNGVPVDGNMVPDFIDQSRPNDLLKDLKAKKPADWIPQIPEPKDSVSPLFTEQYNLKSYESPKFGHMTYENSSGLWKDKNGTPHRPPPDSEYMKDRPGDFLSQRLCDSKRQFQRAASINSWKFYMADQARQGKPVVDE